MKQIPAAERNTSMSATRPLTADAHDAALSSGTAVLVFMMNQSPACKSFWPVLDQVAAERASVPFYVVDPEQEPELAGLHHLRALPTCVFYRDGNPIRRTAGGMSPDDLAAILDEALQADMQKEINDLLVEMAVTQEVLSPLLSRAAHVRPESHVRPRATRQPLSALNVSAPKRPPLGKTGKPLGVSKAARPNRADGA
jgi:thioredoxin-like negative regulator of GroEL